MSDLVEAVKKNDMGSVKELGVGGVDLDGVDDGWGRTALYWAANEGFVECAKVLLAANADVNKGDHNKFTPLHTASYHGYAECVKLLIDWKANVNAKTTSDYSPLHWAAMDGHFACVEMLIQAGAELEARNNYGATPLAWAIVYNKPDAAELLLDKGAKMSNVARAIPNWMKAIITKRQKVKRSLLTFIGVLRKRFAVTGAGTEHIRGRLPRDVVGVISKLGWTTRFDGEWMEVVPETVKKLKQ